MDLFDLIFGNDDSNGDGATSLDETLTAAMKDDFAFQSFRKAKQASALSDLDPTLSEQDDLGLTDLDLDDDIL